MHNALYLVWKLESTEDYCAGIARSRLAAGEDRALYRLRSWAIANGEAHALLAPAAPLEAIVEAIMPGGCTQPLATRWIGGEKACAAAVHKIEMWPVGLGVATRPEQWAFSSASLE